jgi:3-hydroxypropanoate dehydrogenase
MADNLNMEKILDDKSIALLFDDARTYSGWLNTPVSEAMLQKLYDHARWAPTSMNSNPGRFVFVTSAEAKERLKPHLMPLNVDKMMAAPVTAIVARDTRFYEEADTFFPERAPAIKMMAGANETMARDTALRNATLQGGYLILAARALGLDCGGMSGFNADGVNKEFFPDGRWQADFLINIGHGDPASLHPRNPRLSFDQACQII